MRAVPANAKPSGAEALATTIAAVVQRQLNRHTETLSAQLEAERAQSQQVIDQLKLQLVEVNNRLESQLHANEAYQQALQAALEERLNELASHQQSQLAEVDQRFAAQGLETQRADEQVAAIVQHVNDATATLSQRIDEGHEALAIAVEERLVTMRVAVDSIGPDLQRASADQTASMMSKIEYVETSTADRMMTMEDRINERSGTQIAQLEATIGRVGSGFDDSMVALNQRLLEVDNRLMSTNDQVAAIEARVVGFDEEAFAAIKEQVSGAIGESMLVRIELDRYVANTDEKIDKSTLRMAEIEAQLADEMDVSAAVQLERLDELERALIVLDPSQFIRKTDTPMSTNGAGSNSDVGSNSRTGSSATSTSGNEGEAIAPTSANGSESRSTATGSMPLTSSPNPITGEVTMAVLPISSEIPALTLTPRIAEKRATTSTPTTTSTPVIP